VLLGLLLLPFAVFVLVVRLVGREVADGPVRLADIVHFSSLGLGVRIGLFGSPSSESESLLLAGCRCRCPDPLVVEGVIKLLLGKGCVDESEGGDLSVPGE
jgi:hypothetical protein